jgi:demethylmenaquinone methyltransferase/2-methoxy-6-polyprenyl-1,4-benzoquinol methylase
MINTEIYIERLLDSNPLREPLLRSVIQALRLPQGSRGLDAGSGLGLQTLLLAEAIGPAGHVTGLDLLQEFLRYGEKMVEKAGLAGRISFQEGNVSRLPFDDDVFDWVWSADCVGYPAGDLLPLLRELARVVKPGGIVAILAWSSQCLLPGHPLLEARLNATCSGLLPYVSGTRPELHFLRAPGWFGAAGLVDVEARTFAGDVQAPLSADIRRALISLFQMLWGEPGSAVSPEDWADYQRLCRPESPDCILNVPGYYAFFTYSMFRGKVAQNLPQ